jgi:hypothetical protein
LALAQEYEDVQDVLISSYFSFTGQFYEQTDNMAMCTPLSPVITSVFVVDFEEMVLGQATHELLCWFCYMDDTFVI